MKTDFFSWIGTESKFRYFQWAANLFPFQAVDPEQYGDLYQMAQRKNRTIAFPRIGFDEIATSQEAYDLYPNVDVPVVAETIAG